MGSLEMPGTLPLSLKTVAMTLNQGELPLIKAFAEERSLKFRFDAMLNPRIDGTKGPCVFRLPPERVIELDLEYEERSHPLTAETASASVLKPLRRDKKHAKKNNHEIERLKHESTKG